MTFLISLSESDKRILLALCLLLILVFVIFGYLGLIVERIMKRQGDTAGRMLNDVYQAKVITTERDFIRFGRKKSKRLFAKQARIPMLILFFALIIFLIHGITTNKWLYNIFDYKTEGFGTLCFLWDFKNAPHAEFFGIRIISGWPQLLNRPHFEATAWASYLIVPAILIGGCWLLVLVQAHIARTFRIRKLARKLYNPSLDDLTKNIINPTNPTNG